MQNQTEEAEAGLNMQKRSLTQHRILRDVIESTRTLIKRQIESVEASIEDTTNALNKAEEYRMAFEMSFSPILSDNMPEYVRGVGRQLLSCIPCVAVHHDLCKCLLLNLLHSRRSDTLQLRQVLCKRHGVLWTLQAASLHLDQIYWAVANRICGIEDKVVLLTKRRQPIKERLLGLPKETRDMILSLTVPRQRGRLVLHRSDPRFLRQLNVNDATLDWIQQALVLPRIDLDISVWSEGHGRKNLMMNDIKRRELILDKVQILSMIPRRIMHYYLVIDFPATNLLPILVSSANILPYVKTFTVKAHERIYEESINDDIGKDSARVDLRNSIMNAVRCAGPGNVRLKEAQINLYLLWPLANAGLLKSLTHLTLTATSGRLYQHARASPLPILMSDLPTLQSLDVSLVTCDFTLAEGQSTTCLGSIATLRIPNPSFLELCSPSSMVKCFGMKDLSGYKGSAETSLISKIASLFPELRELETVSSYPANYSNLLFHADAVYLSANW